MSAEIIARPVIGVLCIDREEEMDAQTHSYIKTEYVKFLEAAGADVVPICCPFSMEWQASDGKIAYEKAPNSPFRIGIKLIQKERSYYDKMLSKINAVLIPGGKVYVNSLSEQPALTNHCVQAVAYILEIAMSKCDEGIYLPLWGTCLGFQLLITLSSKILDTTPRDCDPRDKCEKMNCCLPVKFRKDYRSSRLFKSLSPQLEEIMLRVPFGNHRHRYCVTIQNLEEWKFQRSVEWRALATNKDSKELEFVTIAECRNYPFYGCQIHPESIMFGNWAGAFTKQEEIAGAIQAVQYLANFFVNESRKNSNRFASQAELSRHLVWNFELKLAREEDDTCIQYFIFEKTSDYPASVAKH